MNVAIDDVFKFFIKRNIKMFKFHILYFALVRLILKYGVIVWDPCSEKDVQDVDILTFVRRRRYLL